MNNTILNDVVDLIELSDDELTEALLDEKYNKALLRELVRRSLKLAKLYREISERERTFKESYENLYEHERKHVEALNKTLKELTK